LSQVAVIDVPLVWFSGKGSALFTDGDCIGVVTPARDIAVKYHH